jgi:hypothetical protein
MSRRRGHVMREIKGAIEAQPRRRFTYEELAAIAYPGEQITHSRLVARPASGSFACARGARLAGRARAGDWFRTARAFDPKAKSPASVVNAVLEQAPS